MSLSSQVQVTLPDAPPAVGKTSDISSGGMRFTLDRHLRIGQEYRINLGPHLVSGHPVWVHYECGTFEIGFRFTSDAPPGLMGRRPQRLMRRVTAEYRVRLSDATGPLVRGLTRDLSWHGARMLSAAPFDIGRALIATFDFESHGELELPVEIVRCIPAEQHYELGLSFHPQADASRRILEAVLRERMESR